MSIKLDLSEELTTYKTDLDKALSIIENELNSLNITLTPISKNQITYIEQLLKDSESNLKHIELELNLLPKTTKDKFNNNIKNYLERINRYRKIFIELKKSRNKEEIIRNDENVHLKINHKLDSGLNLIGESLRTMREINETDSRTMTKLKEQTDILNSASSKLNNAEGYIDRSDNVLKNMLKRVFTNKLVLFAIIILLSVINIFLIYIKIKYKLLGISNN